MKLLDRYIIKQVLATFFFVMMILVAVIVVIDITEKVDKFNDHHLKLQQVVGYYLNFVPWISGLLTPIICFIAIVYVTSRMASHTEIVAMLSSGMSFLRLLLPYFIASSIIASLSFFFNGWIIPHSNRHRLEFEMQNFKSTYYFERRNVHIQAAPDVLLYMASFNNQTNMGYQFSLEKFKDNRLVEKLTADNIQWDTTKLKWTMHTYKIKMVDELFDINSKKTTVQQGLTLDTTLVITPKDFENDEQKYDGMTIPELDKHIEKLRFRGSTGVETYEVEWHNRFAAPCTTFVLVFMGVIVSARKSRGGTGFQIALGFFLAFIFILFFTMSRTFAQTGSLRPIVAAWLPNSVFGLLSLIMYKYVPR